VALAQQEPVAAGVDDPVGVHVEHPVVEDPEHVEGGLGGCGVLLVARHGGDEPEEVVVRLRLFRRCRCHATIEQVQVNLKSRSSSC
jgi:hypothetical protein